MFHMACPCLHTTPCHPRCTCLQSSSSSGCALCCSYGSPEQQKERAENLAKLIDKTSPSLSETNHIHNSENSGRGCSECDLLFNEAIRELHKEALAKLTDFPLFNAGDIIECVDDTGAIGSIVKGQKYTVRAYFNERPPLITLQENGTKYWYISRFRKVISEQPVVVSKVEDEPLEDLSASLINNNFMRVLDFLDNALDLVEEFVSLFKK